MNIKMVSLLAVIATMLSLCACGGQIDANTKGKGQEIGAASSVALDPSSSQTTDQSGGETGTTSGQTEIVSGQTEINPVQTTETIQATTTTTRALEVLTNGNSTWKEIPVKEVTYWGKSNHYLINLKKVITNADYVFKGTVVGHKEYEASWADENGEPCGPRKVSIVEVEINHEYYGQSPVKGNTIKIYSPFSISTSDNSVLVKEHGEYVFITKLMDDEYVEQRNKQNPADRAGEENYADVYVSGAYYCFFPVDNGNVFAYHQYFNWDNNIMEKAKSNVKTDKIHSLAMKDEWYITLDIKDFDEAFNQLFMHPDILPPVDSR